MEFLPNRFLISTIAPVSYTHLRGFKGQKGVNRRDPAVVVHISAGVKALVHIEGYETADIEEVHKVICIGNNKIPSAVARFKAAYGQL